MIILTGRRYYGASISKYQNGRRVKKSMKSTCHELGINMTTAFTIFAKKVSREKRIPFEISIDPFYSESNIGVLEESIQQFKEGKVITKTLEELREMEK